ncbi:hypothetical protein VH571_13815 [Frondihabitans sp. 4ASC-45]|uniref:hypothetical protein n=1 Tax=Frondihabitans sp. 4ASC-45 TaxID=3111636 RepID=UPI003C22A106
MNRITRQLRAIVDRDPEAGLGLVEVIIAMMVFSMIAVGVAATITNSLLLTRDGRARTTAANLIAQDLDLQRSVADVFSVQSKKWDTTVQGTTYHLTRTVAWNSSSTATSACGSGTGTLQFKTIRDNVTWDGQRGSGSVSSSTVLAPNSRINDPNLGTIIVAVTGANGAGLPGVAVTIAPTSTTPNGADAVAAPSVTDANGCTYALKVKPGNYKVSITKTNGIDINQVVNPSFTPAVAVAGTATTVPFTYDTAATFKLNYASNYSGTASLPTDLDLTFNSTTGGIDSFQPGSTNPVALFPFSSYTYETGALVPNGLTDKANKPIASCLNVDPANWTTKNAAGKVGVGFTTGGAPGALTSPVNIPMGVVKLPDTLGLTGIIATSVNSTANGDPGCQTGVQYTFNAVSGSPVLALPFGTWKFSTLGGLLGITPGSNAVLTGGTVNGSTVTLDPRGVTP